MGNKFRRGQKVKVPYYGLSGCTFLYESGKWIYVTVPNYPYPYPCRKEYVVEDK